MGFYPLHDISTAVQLLLRHSNIFFLFPQAQHFMLCITHTSHSCDNVSLKGKKTNEVKHFCLKPRIISFHKILLCRVFLHEILQNKLTIFSVTMNGKIKATNLFLEQWFCILLCIWSIKSHIRASFWILFPSKFISNYMDLCSSTRSSI